MPQAGLRLALNSARSWEKMIPRRRRVALAATGRWLLGAGLTVVAVANAGLLRLLQVNERVQR